MTASCNCFLKLGVICAGAAVFLEGNSRPRSGTDTPGAPEMASTRWPMKERGGVQRIASAGYANHASKRMISNGSRANDGSARLRWGSRAKGGSALHGDCSGAVRRLIRPGHMNRRADSSTTQRLGDQSVPATPGVH